MYKVVDLFSGAGGLSEGFRLAGFNVIGGIDFDENAICTFNHNFKGARGVCADLTNISEADIYNNFNDYLSADVIIGGPPCQGFSSANRHNLDEMDDPRNRLFFQFVKFVDTIHPKAIVIENVRGIVTANNGYAKRRIYEIFENKGYKVNHRVLDASQYGVPQKRMRNFFVMKLGDEFNFDNITKEIGPTVYESLGELYPFEKEKGDILLSRPKTKFQKYLRRPDDKIINHDIRYPSKIVQERISFVPQGGNWKDVPEYLFKNNRNNRHSSAYKRLREDDFSVTIDTGNSHSNYFHPIYNRIPTVREAARLQSFSDNFEFFGSRTSQYRQVGNAVPPLLSRAVANELRRELDSEEK